jgi:type IV pilus assembly protein PilE
VKQVLAKQLGKTAHGGFTASWRAGHGFTLLELMIVVAIVGILASIAYPSYMDHVRKGNRAKAQAFLMDVAQRQQNYLLVNRQYAATLADLGVTVGTEGGSLGADLASLASAYDLTGMELGVDNEPPLSFNMTLNPQLNSLQASDGSLCLANTGARARYCGGANETPW